MAFWISNCPEDFYIQDFMFTLREKFPKNTKGK